MKSGKDAFWGAPEKGCTQIILVQWSKRRLKPQISMFQMGYSEEL